MSSKPSFAAGFKKQFFPNKPGDNDTPTFTPDPAVASERESLWNAEREIDVTLDEIEIGSYNPRQTENDNYLDIKHSIATMGLNQTPVVTKKHVDDTLFQLWGGGGTRLRILRELYDETGDEKYFRLRVLYRPFGSDLYNLVRHLSENAHRGNLKWVENALQIDKILKSLIQQEGDPNLSLRAKAELITKAGFKISHDSLIRYQYTTDVLLEAIPNSLWAGAGRPLVLSLKRLEKSYTDFIAERLSTDKKASAVNAAKFRTVFVQALNTVDKQNVPVDCQDEHLINLLDTGAADIIGCNVEDVVFSMSTNAMLSHNSMKSDDLSVEPTIETPANSTPPPSSAVSKKRKKDKDVAKPATRQSVHQIDSGDTVTNDTPLSIEAIHAELCSLRRRAQEIALGLATDYKLLMDYEMSPNNGNTLLGFMIGEPPLGIDLSEYWLHGIVYTRLYLTFYTAFKTEASAQMLLGDELNDIASRFDIEAIHDSSTLSEQTLLVLQWRWEDVKMRASVNIDQCANNETRIVTDFSELSNLLYHHSTLIASLKAMEHGKPSTGCS